MALITLEHIVIYLSTHSIPSPSSSSLLSISFIPPNTVLLEAKRFKHTKKIIVA